MQTDHFHDEEDVKGVPRITRTIVRGIRKTNFPEHVTPPDPSKNSGIIEISKDCRGFIESVMTIHGLRGKNEITDKSRINIAWDGGKKGYDGSNNPPWEYVKEAGFSIATPSDSNETVRVNWIYVVPNEQGRGTGKKLFKTVLDQFPEKILTGKIVDQSGRMGKIAKNAGAQKNR